MKRMIPLYALLAGACVALVGCAKPEFTVETFKQMIEPRPAELDHLNVFLGTWEMTGEMKAGDSKPMHGTWTVTGSWELDQRAMLVKYDGKIEGELVEKGVEVWTWNSGTKRYDIWGYSNFGFGGEGHGRYNAEKKEFRVAMEHDMGGHKSRARGTMTIVDDKTVTWTHTGYDALGLFKQFEGCGTMKKK